MMNGTTIYQDIWNGDQQRWSTKLMVNLLKIYVLSSRIVFFIWYYTILMVKLQEEADIITVSLL